MVVVAAVVVLVVVVVVVESPVSSPKLDDKPRRCLFGEVILVVAGWR